MRLLKDEYGGGGPRGCYRQEDVWWCGVSDDGKMFCGIVKNDLMVRVGPGVHEKALGEPHVRPMDFSGRPMKGYVYVGPQGSKTDTMVQRWVERAIKFVATVEKGKKPGRKKARTE